MTFKTRDFSDPFGAPSSLPVRLEEGRISDRVESPSLSPRKEGFVRDDSSEIETADGGGGTERLGSRDPFQTLATDDGDWSFGGGHYSLNRNGTLRSHEGRSRGFFGRDGRVPGTSVGL